MAIINKMRKKGWVFVVILGALALFVLSDLISGFQKGGSGMEDPIVGSIEGREIKYSEYDEVYKQRLQGKEQSNKGAALTESDKTMAGNDAWDDLFRKYVVEKEYEKLGIVAGIEELSKLIFTDDAHPIIKQYFTNEQGEFSGRSVLEWYRNVYNSTADAQVFFNSIKAAVVSSVQSAKYKAMIEKALYVTNFEALNDFIEQSRTTTGNVFGLEIATVNDSLVSYTEDDLKQYYAKNKDNFKRKESRDLEFVSWTTVPSSFDSSDVLLSIQQDMPLFASTTDDSAFATMSSERDVYLSYRAASELATEISKDVMMGEKGQVLGPFLVQGAYGIVKIVDIREGDRPKYKYAQIGINRNWENKADSLVQISEAKDFVSFIKENGFEKAQEEAQARGYFVMGELPWSEFESIDPTFASDVIKAKKGDYIVKANPMGINIIVIEENPSSKEVIAVEIYKQIEPSSATINETYNNASMFRDLLTDGTNGKFDEELEKAGFAKRIAKEIYRKGSKIPGFDDASEIITWAFDKNRTVNEISEVLFADGRQVIVHIADLINDGIGAFDDVRDQVVESVLFEKKKEYLYNKLKESIKGKNSIVQVALDFGKVAYDFNRVTFKSESFQAANDEARVQGVALAIEKGVISQPIIGQNGVYVVMVDDVFEPEIPQDLNSRKMFVNAPLIQMLELRVVGALKALANIEDSRDKYFF